MNPIRPLYHDEALLVLEKPAGLLAVPGRGPDKQDCLSARVQAVFPEARVVHRLDMATSGLMLMAHSLDAQRKLNLEFELRRVGKRYVALVAGRLAAASGEIALPLLPDLADRPRQIVDSARGRTALTRYLRLGYEPALDATRVELTPLTGRTHQLRVHMQALGHPILGDSLYAPDPLRAPRLMLHAAMLAIVHPVRRTALVFESAVPF